MTATERPRASTTFSTSGQHPATHSLNETSEVIGGFASSISHMSMVLDDWEAEGEHARVKTHLGGLLKQMTAHNDKLRNIVSAGFSS